MKTAIHIHMYRKASIKLILVIACMKHVETVFLMSKHNNMHGP